MVDRDDIQAAARSVTRNNPFTEGNPGGIGFPFNVLAQFLGGIPEWGTDINARDAMMSAFLIKESVASSAVATVASRNAAYSWEITAESDTLRESVTDILLGADLGRGWEHFAMNVGMDYLTQDKGAFIEIIRTANSPEAPIVGLQHLPAIDCWSTGKIEFPVVFRDKAGKVHRLAWYQVYRLSEEPRPHPVYDGLQLSALSRFLAKARIHFNISTYTEEKTGGRNNRAMYFVNGVSSTMIDSALAKLSADADNAGYRRYIPPVIIPALADKMAAEVAKIEFASLPDSFDAEQDMRQYLMVLSLALLVDFQELAPLPSGNIGTGSQSDTLDQKSRQKGAALWRKKISGMMAAILPPQATFSYTEQDVDEEQIIAENKEIRANARKTQVDSGELDSEGSRALAVEQGDIPIEIADEVAARGKADEEKEPEPNPFGAPAPFADPDAPVDPENVAEGNEETKAVPVRPERMELEEETVDAVDETLGKVFARVKREIREREE